MAHGSVWSAEARKDVVQSYNSSLEKEYETVGTSAFVPVKDCFFFAVVVFEHGQNCSTCRRTKATTGTRWHKAR